MRLVSACLLLACMAASSLGADNAERGFALFSGEGRYFAFEQFGIQDGSGFPYSKITVIDLDKDRWAVPPVNIRLENEDASLVQARAEAAAKAKPILDKFGIRAPGETLASNPATEFVSDRRKVTFAPYYQSLGPDSKTHTLPQSGRFTLAATLIAFPIGEACYGEEAAQYGFALTLSDNDAGTSREIYRDKSIPASRLCPMTYDLADIFVYRKFGSRDRHVALIGVYTRGFEGLDRRLLAVPFELP